MKISYYLPTLNFIKKKFKIISIIVLLYLFFLIINFPANIVLSTIDLPSNIKLTSVSGTIWSRKAQQFRYSGIGLGSVKWELHPLNLIMGELSAKISIINNQQYIKSNVNFSSSGKIELEDTRFLIDLSLFQPLTYGMPFSYSGIALGYFPISFFHKNNYVGVNGKLSLNNMEMTSPQRQSFGGFVIDFRAEKEGATSAQINDSGGPLNLVGQLILNKNGQVDLSAKLAAREAGSSLEQMLSFLGRKDANGSVQLNSSFKFWH